MCLVFDSHWRAASPLLAGLFVVVGCNQRDAGSTQSQTPSASASVLPAPTPAVPASLMIPPVALASGEAPHDGVTAPIASGKVRVSAIKAGNFRVWLLGKDDKIASIENTTVTVQVALAGHSALKLEPVGDHFQGKGPPMDVDHPKVTVTVEQNDKKEVAHLELHLEAEDGHHHEHEEHSKTR